MLLLMMMIVITITLLLGAQASFPGHLACSVLGPTVAEDEHLSYAVRPRLDPLPPDTLCSHRLFTPSVHTPLFPSLRAPGSLPLRLAAPPARVDAIRRGVNTEV